MIFLQSTSTAWLFFSINLGPKDNPIVILGSTLTLVPPYLNTFGIEPGPMTYHRFTRYSIELSKVATMKKFLILRKLHRMSRQTSQVATHFWSSRPSNCSYSSGQTKMYSFCPILFLRLDFINPIVKEIPKRDQIKSNNSLLPPKNRNFR